MQDLKPLFDDLASLGLGSWRERLEETLSSRFSESAHGDFRIWRSVLSALPDVEKQAADLNSSTIRIPASGRFSKNDLRELLLSLSPWRKGPFDVCGVTIDSEWQSDLKWDRLKDAIAPLRDRSVLDVGCGNGYYALRMRGLGAGIVIGIDPMLLYVMQFEAIRHFMQAEPVHVLPLRLHEVPENAQAFDTAFSMGVLYHQREPAQHLGQLRSALRPGGELILETLILPGSESVAKTPEDRYARMRNVWHLPTLPMLETWLKDAGFENVRVVDTTPTTPEEQRSTEWMLFESLAEALDPADPGRTIEGWPAPRRAILVGSRP